MKRTKAYFFVLLLATTLSAGATSCAKKAEEGPAGDVDTEYLKEALGGQPGGKEAEEQRRKIEERRKQREVQEAEAQKRKQRELALAEAQRKRSAQLASNDPQRAKLEEICKRCGFHLDEKNLDAALGQAKALVAQRPNSPDAHTVLGLVLKRKGSLDEAVQEYQTAVDLDPTNDWAAANLGLGLRRQGQYPKAAEAYEAAATANPKAQLVHYEAGILYEIYLADKVKAIQHYIAYLNAGGERQEEVNTWITTLASDLQVERPMTPGYKPPPPPEEPKPPEEPAPAAPPAEDAPAGSPPAAAPIPSGAPSTEGGTPPSQVGAPAAAGAAAVPPAGATPPAPVGAAAATTAVPAPTSPGAPATTGAAPPLASEAVAPVPVAAATPAVAPAVLPTVTLYPFITAGGQVGPKVMEQIDSIFRTALGESAAITESGKISETEQKENLVGQCGNPKCQVRVASLVGAEYLVHGEISQSADSWLVTVDIYNLTAKKKARLKFQIAATPDNGPLFEKAGQLAKAVAQKISSGFGSGGAPADEGAP